MEKLRKENARLEEQEKKRGQKFTKVEWFKPQKGDNKIRILPDPDAPDDNLPYRRVHIHFFKKTLEDGRVITLAGRCLREFDEECPLCDEYEVLVKKDKDAARNLRRVERYIYNIIDLHKMSVHPYAAGKTVHEQITGCAGDVGTDMGTNVFSLEDGRGWTLVKKVTGAGAFNVSYGLRVGPSNSKLPSKLMPLVDEALDLKTLYSENLRSDMLKFLGYEEDDEEYAGVDLEKDVKEAPEFEAEEEMPDFKPKAKKAAKKAARRKRVEEDEAEIDVEDDDVDAELRALGIS